MAGWEAPRSARTRVFWAVLCCFIGCSFVIGYVTSHQGRHEKGLALTPAPAARPGVRPKPREPVQPAAPATAQAPTHPGGCTDIWTGGGDRVTWTQTANWSAHHAPTDADQACIGPATVVAVVDADAVTGSLRDEGTLYVRRHSALRFTDLTHRSHLAAVALEGRIEGEATVVIRRLTWESGGSMTGAGTTVFPASSVVVFNAGDGGSGLIGRRRTVSLSGQFALASGALYLDATAHLRAAHGHVSINPYSATGQPAGLLQRGDGQPVRVTGRVRVPPGFVTGTPGRHHRRRP